MSVFTLSQNQSASKNSPELLYFQDSYKTQRVLTPLEIFGSQAWNDPLFTQQWFLRNEGQTAPSNRAGKQGADIQLPEELLELPNRHPVILALIDSGIDMSHPDLNFERLFINNGESGLDHQGQEKSKNGIDDDENGFVDDVQGWSFADDSPVQRDSLGHGTHLAGLLLARSNNGIGIASPWTGFNVMPLQIFSGAHPSVPVEKVAASIRYAVDHGARVISASFGTSFHSDSLLKAIEYAREKDVLVVSAVGNFRKNLDKEPSFPASYALENQLSVAASDNRDLATLFTNYGLAAEIFAPGEAILSTAPGGSYAIRSGTSQACPLVSAAAAQLRSVFPEKSAVQIKQLILEAADEKPGFVGFSQNARRLNFKNALLQARGERLSIPPQTKVRHVEQVVESEHPYRATLRQNFPIVVSSDALSFRLHFERFSTQSTDVLMIRDSKGTVTQQLSGELGSFWSAYITGGQALLEFQTDAYVSDWGWRIDKIELIAP